MEDKIREKLTEVLDPELNISIVDLGLIYDIKQKSKDSVYIKMTLTTLGCPLFDTIERDIKAKMEELGFKKTEIELTFDPPWSIDNLSERAKAILGI
ncbi:MAG: hypothetical protein KatS3mg090_0383 [Patescibacteria group bacterium]|nr:MAG: hypothetical protein KatS3mg090_0383 [Patescibacteria group bacterium]